MSHFTPVRDAAGGIVGMRPKDGESAFSATLAETLAAVGAGSASAATPAPAPIGRDAGGPSTFGRRELAMMMGGLVAALILVAALNGVRTPGANAPPAKAEHPSSAPVAPTPTPTPTTPAPTPTPTTLPTPEPPTPIVIVEPAPPPIACYTIRIDVSDDRGVPIGIAEGYSCVSREAAQANAEAHAEQVRATYTRRR